MNAFEQVAARPMPVTSTPSPAGVIVAKGQVWQVRNRQTIYPAVVVAIHGDRVEIRDVSLKRGRLVIAASTFALLSKFTNRAYGYRLLPEVVQ